MKIIFKKLLYTLGILILIISAAESLFPQQTMNVFNNIEHYINNNPSDDIIELEENDLSLLYSIDASINGCEMKFILDTGCSCISMSIDDFNYLKRNGYISNDDYCGKMETTNADGDKDMCRLYNIEELQIGDYIINDVKCSVSNHSTALPLLGQEVLSHFKSITINYSNNTLKVEI